MQINHYNAAVIGTGLAGLGCTNLLSQMKGKRIINIGLKGEEQVQIGNASLHLQGIQICGQAWVGDPFKGLSGKLFGEFLRIESLLNQRFINPREISRKGVAVLNKGQMDYLDKDVKEGMIGKPSIITGKEFSQLTQLPWYEGTYYIRTMDKAYNTSFLMNGMYEYSKNTKNVDFRFSNDGVEFEPYEKPGVILVKVDGEFISADKIFICAGVNTFKIIDTISKFSFDELLRDKEIIGEDFTKEFKFFIARTPIIRFKKKHGIKAEVIIDSSRKLALVNHKDCITISTSKCTQEIRELNIKDEYPRDTEDFERLLKMSLDWYPDLEMNDHWFCNRVERELKTIQGLYIPSISGWTGRVDGFENIYYGNAGKGTLALGMAESMVNHAYLETCNYNFWIDPEFQSGPFLNRF